jgi:hypothetical protein
MINKDKFVPNKKIIYIFSDIDYVEKDQPVSTMVQMPKVKRKWFAPFFYNCLPISISNSYGMSIVLNYDLELTWGGGNSEVKFVKTNKKKYPVIKSNLYPGLISLDFPFSLRTPPNVNLIVTAPFNEFIPNIQTVTAVIESDNLRRHFGLVLRMVEPGTVKIESGTVIATILPIPRYYADQFDLIDAAEVFNEEDVIEEENALNDFKIRKTLKRFLDEEDKEERKRLGGNYFHGYDIYGNRFMNHQKGRKK